MSKFLLIIFNRLKMIALFLLVQLNVFPAETAINPEFFGLHIHQAFKTDQPWPVVKFKIWRLWDAGICWPEIQPEKNRWNFEQTDQAVKLAEKHNVILLLNLGLSPQWAASRPQDRSGYGGNLTPSEPRHISDWQHYVRVMAERYKGRIRYWEIWNEPDLGLFYTGSIEKMVELVKTAYKILKEVDPANQIISPPITGYLISMPWFDRFLKSGGKNYIDIIGSHLYLWFKNDRPENIRDNITAIQQIMKKHGLSNKPLWITESGFLHKNIINDTEGAGYLARLTLLSAVYGVQCFIPYSYDNSVVIRMTEKESNQLNQLGSAYNEIQKWLIGARILSYNETGKIRQVTLIRSDGSKGLIIWNPAVKTGKKKINFILNNSANWTQQMNLQGERNNISKGTVMINSVPLLICDEGYYIAD